MSTYFKTVLAAIFCIGIIEGILPKDGAGKIASFALGIFLLCVLLSPLRDMEERMTLSIPDFSEDTKQIDADGYLMDTFEETLAKRVEEEIKKQTGKALSVTIFADADEKMSVTVTRAEISLYNEENAKRVAAILGITKEKVVEGG